jgi:uroporphyrin-III C-methyltransferase
VYLVGAGPGAPDLLTIRAARILAAAEVVLYDRLVPPEILALAPESAEFIYCGKDEGHQDQMQQQIFDLLLERARAGRTIVRLKGGDPFLFGRGAEEALFLRAHGISVDVVPGVSSALSVPALAGVPVTYRGISHSVTIVSGRCKGGRLGDWAPHANAGTLVILMGVRYRDRIARALIDSGRPAHEPAVFIERGSTPEERIVETTLAEIAAGRTDVSAPAVLVVGEVTRLRSALAAVTEETAA